MGWREELEDEFAATGSGWPGTRAERAMARILDMPPADRIALARELLAGTEWVPARDVEIVSVFDEYNQDWDMGWNACRAAMLGEDP